LKSARTFLIDVTFLLDASHKAFLGAPLLVVEGVDYTFLFGVVRDILRLRRLLGIDNGIVVIGTDAYKVTEEHNIREVITFLENLPIHVLHDKNHRVLDISASLSQHVTHFVTQNKSLLSLATETRGIVLVRDKNEFEHFTSKTVQSKYGVDTKAIPSFLALTEGQKSSTFTKRQACALLEQCRNLERILEDTSIISARQIRNKLTKNQAVLLENLKNFSCRSDLPACEFNPNVVDIDIDNEDCAKLLRSRHFFSLVRLLPRPSQVELSSVSSKSQSRRLEYHAIQEPEALQQLLTEIRAHEYCSVDTETSDKNPHTAELYGVSFSFEMGKAYYLPTIDVHLKRLERESVLAAIKEILQGTVKVIGHNLKFDYLMLRRHGIRINRYYFDTMLAASDCFDDWDLLNLSSIAEKTLGQKIKTYKEIAGKAENFLELPFKELLDHACSDADITLQLFRILEKEIDRRGLSNSYRDGTLALGLHLGEWEYDGIPVDTEGLANARQSLLQGIAASETAIHNEAAISFNIDSEKELRAVLFKMPGLSDLIGTRKLTLRLLEELAVSQPLVRKVVEYRRQQKQLRHVEGLIKSVQNDKLHPIFNQTKSGYGRLSSASPRLFDTWISPRVFSCIKHPVSDYFYSPGRSLETIQQLSGDDVLRDDRTTKEEIPFAILKVDELPSDFDYDELLLSIMIGLPKERICRAFFLSQATLGSLCHDMELRYVKSFKWLDSFRNNVRDTSVADIDGRYRRFNGVKCSNLEKRDKSIINAVKWLLKY
jgi:DNA polymerase-1